ncbi:MAG: hypothetical protein WD038_09600 [Balneolales bacterium]
MQLLWKINLWAFLLGIALLMGCGNLYNARHGIQWVEEDLNDYALYIFAPYKDTLSVVDLLSGERYHQFTEFKGIQSVIANPEGTRLYVSTGSGISGGNPGKIYEVDTATWEHQIIHNSAAHMIAGLEGGIFFLNKEGELRILGSINPGDGTVNIIDALDVYRGAWFEDSLIAIDNNNGYLYALDDNNKFFRYDFERKTTENLFSEIDFDTIAHFQLSKKGNQIYIPGGKVLDVNQNKVVGILSTPYLGSVAARQDNKEVYVTDPGGYFHDPEPLGRIKIYSPPKDRIIGEVKVETEGEPSRADQIYLTQNERYAVVNDWDKHIFIIDLQTREVIKTHRFTDEDTSSILVRSFWLAPKPDRFR